MRQVPVLVVGGALTGLSTALFLGLHGVPCLLVERRDAVLPHPRLRGLLPRAMELFRQAGLEKEIRALCPDGAGSGDLVSVHAETLADDHETLVERGDEDSADGPDPAELSPCAFAPLGQDELEELLCDRARHLGADVRFGTELLRLEQDTEQVTALLRGPDGATSQVRARYAVAADGASSGLRRELGVRSDGPGTLFQMATMHLHADLRPALRGRPLGMAYLRHPGPGTTLGPLDATGTRWFFATSCPPGPRGRPPEPAPEECARWVRAATGLPDLRVRLTAQVPGTDTRVFTFPVGARVARHYRAGRVLLAGDAAHLMPPTGGLGGTTAVEDAHNLAWKLALVLRGSATPSLLDTYAAERRPVAERAMRQSVARARSRWRLSAYDEVAARLPDEPLLDFYDLTYGYQYRSSAVPHTAGDDTPADGTPAGRTPADLPLLPASRLRGSPGSRAPHVTVAQDGGEPLSTLDLYGTDFVVLAGPDGDAWEAAGHRAAERLSVTLDTYHLDEELAAPHGLRPGGALLVRPDGFVAWRAPGPVADPAAALEAALRTLLGRPSPATPAMPGP